MKRTLFRRKTPMNTSRRSSLQRTPLNTVSLRRQAELTEYRALRGRLVLTPWARCVVCGDVPCDLHHRREMGMGGALSNPRNVVPVCRSCHNRVHDEQAWSRSQGLLVFEGDAGWADLGARVWRQR